MATTSLNTPYILITGTIVIAVVIMFTVLQPLLSSISDTQGHITTATSVLTEKQEFLHNLDQKKQDLQVQQVHEQRLNVIIPSSQQYDDFIRSISLASDSSGVSIQKMENKTSGAQSAVNSERARGEIVTIPSGVNVVAAEVDVISSYQQLRSFLSALEKSPRLLDVTQVTAQADQAKPDVISTKLVIRSYFEENK